jgi:hypothetical protein
LIGAADQNVYLIVTVFALTIHAIGIALLTQGALSGIYAAALYRYASGGQMTDGFDASTIKLAFAPKK